MVGPQVGQSASDTRSRRLSKEAHGSPELDDATDSELREIVVALLPTVTDRRALLRTVELLMGAME